LELASQSPHVISYNFKEAEIPEEICADTISEETTPSKQRNNIVEKVSDTGGAAAETEVDVNNGTLSYYEDDFEDDSEAEVEKITPTLLFAYDACGCVMSLLSKLLEMVLYEAFG